MSTLENNRNVIQTLSRIRRIIRDAVRAHESSLLLDHQQLSTAQRNLERLSASISESTYISLKEALDGLILLASNTQESQAYSVARSRSNGKFLPYLPYVLYMLESCYVRASYIQAINNVENGN